MKDRQITRNSTNTTARNQLSNKILGIIRCTAMVIICYLILTIKAVNCRVPGLNWILNTTFFKSAGDTSEVFLIETKRIHCLTDDIFAKRFENYLDGDNDQESRNYACKKRCYVTIHKYEKLNIFVTTDKILANVRKNRLRLK